MGHFYHKNLDQLPILDGLTTSSTGWPCPSSTISYQRNSSTIPGLKSGFELSILEILLDNVKRLPKSTSIICFAWQREMFKI